ncbi:MAG: hypothetical protein BGP02_04430 [Pandoraea sp. 64-18]|nr:MAG: hypothetical protein BGP02_04430 [Pandoraea sp. 64-18]
MGSLGSKAIENFQFLVQFLSVSDVRTEQPSTVESKLQGQLVFYVPWKKQGFQCDAKIEGPVDSGLMSYSFIQSM